MNHEFLEHINKYHPIQWLFKSAELNRRSSDNPENIHEPILNPAFQLIVSDIAIRVSQNRKLIGKMPTDEEFGRFIHLYINTQSFIQSELVKNFGLLALSLTVVEQVKIAYPAINLIGRLFLLYSKYENELIKITGLKTSQFLSILIALMVQYRIHDIHVFEVNNIILDTVDGLDEKTVIDFLDYFAIDVRGYRIELKNVGLDKRKLYSFRLLEKKPIIKIDSNKYIVPSIDNLIHSLTSNLNIHLLSHFSENRVGKKYHDSMGDFFEEYVRLLTHNVFDDLVEASEVVPKNNDIAEFIINYEEVAIVVEVKKFHFLRDTAFKNTITDLETLLERHILKAYKQIESTFKFTQKEKKIGIIVTLGDLHLQTAITGYLRDTFPNEGAEFLDNIIIMSIGTYESLLANSPEDIIFILNSYLEKEPMNKGDVFLEIISQQKLIVNPFLKKTFDTEFEQITGVT